MYCCSSYQNYNEPLIHCYEKCIFCLGKFSDQHIFLTYNNDVFKINNKLYFANCKCRPFCHILCMKSWLTESVCCPECSIYFTEIVEKKHCVFENLCAYFLIFVCVSTFTLVIIVIIVLNKHIL